MYILAKSAAKRADSSPPSPDLTSSTMSSASCGSRGASMSVSWVSSSATRASSSAASSANDSSSAASSRAVSRSSRAATSLRYVPTIGANRANRRPALRASSGLLCSSGSASRRSSSACSASSTSMVCTGSVMSHLLPHLPQTRTDARPAQTRTVRASVSHLFVGCGLALAVALLETGHPAAAVENLLLAGVEGVALRADLDDDVAAGLGAAGLEGVPAPAVHGGLRVGGVNVSFHDVLFDRLPPGPGVNSGNLRLVLG